MYKTECSQCGIELYNEIDTFGPIDGPLCWNCYAEAAHEGLVFPERHMVSGIFVGLAEGEVLPGWR